MYCYQCGKKQLDSSKFCFACGASLLQSESAGTASSESKQLSEIARRAKWEGSDIAADTNQVPENAVKPSSDTHPWRRYFAHFIDVLILGSVGSFAIGVLLYLLFPNHRADLDLLFKNPFVSVVLVYLAAIPLEAILLSTRGTTLGKGIFGIRVENMEGKLLSFFESLQRGFSRWLHAEGLGIPVVTLITNLSAYNTLTGKGVTSYDEALRVRVTHKKWGALRAIFAVLSTVLAFMAVSFMNAVQSQL